jgi:hypothetical protein
VSVLPFRLGKRNRADDTHELSERFSLLKHPPKVCQLAAQIIDDFGHAVGVFGEQDGAAA